MKHSIKHLTYYDFQHRLTFSSGFGIIFLLVGTKERANFPKHQNESHANDLANEKLCQKEIVKHT